MDSDSGYDYDGRYSDDGGSYYDSDAGGYYSNDQSEEPYAGELQVDAAGVEEEDCGEVEFEAAGDYGGEEEYYGEREEDYGGEVEIEVEVESDGDYIYGDEMEVPIEGSEDDEEGGARIVYYDDESEDDSDSEDLQRAPSLLMRWGPIPLVRRREIDQVAYWNNNDASSVSQELRREMTQATENYGCGGVRDGKGVSDLEKKKQDLETTSSSGGNKLNGSEMDRFSCPICMEPWTTDEEHFVCCLPCGHLYGMSCIKSWLVQPNSGKCPQCNKACNPGEIRRIYGLTIGTMDKELQEKIRLLEAKCASLELKDSHWQRKEAEWCLKEALLRLQLKQE